jgi:hypothetical protein
VSGKTLASTKTILSEDDAVNEIAKLIYNYLKDFPGEEPLHIVIERSIPFRG